MRPSPGDRICGQVQIDEEAAADVGARAFGATLVATSHDDEVRTIWLTVIERSWVPSQIDVSQFMARMGEQLGAQRPGLVPVRLVDREADFCVVGYEALPGAVPLQRRIEGSGSTSGLVARVAVEVARGLAELHRRGQVHGALAPGNIVLWKDGVSIWQHGLVLACATDAVSPSFRTLGADVVAPEVRSGGSPTACSDVFAWGAVVAALATDTVGSAALAAVEDGELAAGGLTGIIEAALANDPAGRPTDGVALLRRIAESTPEPGSVGAARQAELRELASRYLDEIEGRSKPTPAEPSRPPGKRRQFRRTATELHPPELSPIAGVMIAPDEPEPDPFTVPTDAVMPAQVKQEAPERTPTPAPIQITARRIEDEPARQLNPDALTPPDGAQLSEFDGPRPAGSPAPESIEQAIVLPPLTAPGVGQDGFTPSPGPLPQTAPPPQRPRTPTPPPTDVHAPIPPPPAHDLMSAEDSGFGLSLPISESLDSRFQGDDASAVVGALAAAESSPHLSAVDGERAERNPALLDEAPLELDLPRARGPSATTPKGPARPAPAPTKTPPTTPGPPPVDVAAARPASVSMPAPGARLELDAQRPRARPPRAQTGPSPVVRAQPPGAARPPEALSEARGPRGSMMAALLGFGATLLAVGLTIPVAQERGGLSVLLGDRAPVRDPSETDGAPRPPDPVQAGPSAPPTTCPDDMVSIAPAACIEIGEFPGLRQIPKTGVTLVEATTGCETRGRRLCTGKEWRSACKGEDRRRQPYAGARQEGRCNDAARGVPQNLGRSGARGDCVTPQGVFDLVGNVSEWVDDGSVMGGDATTRQASCNTRRKLPLTTQDGAVGFRCCVTLAEPNPSGLE